MAPRPKSTNVFGILALSVLALAAGVILMTNADSNVRAASGGDEKSARGWRLGEAVTYENLTVFPVYASRQAETSGFATLDEALASGDAIVTEQGSYMRRTRDDGGGAASYGSAQVNQLVLINRGKRPLLLLAGEVVSGGKQDRVIGKDRIVPIGADPLPLSVFCVEHGRWTGGTDKFKASGTIVHPSVREKAAVDQSQAQVWAAVRGAAPMSSARAGTTAGSRTATGAPAAAPALSQNDVDAVIASNAPTMSYKQIYESPRVGRSVEELAGQLQKRFERTTKDHDVVGVVVAFGGEVAWSDVFASASLFETYWPKLLRSYAVEALSRPATRETASLDDAREFLRPASGRIREETEPGVYRWREQTEGPAAEIEIEALEPKPVTLHWMKVLRAS
ncbi:MAG TPA: DUF6569 family protein [Candidatus Acidoferrales bacterium]|nr:DUF6569 family protein [Candidatus Acidoferrales bacterium]